VHSLTGWIPSPPSGIRLVHIPALDLHPIPIDRLLWALVLEGLLHLERRRGRKDECESGEGEIERERERDRERLRGTERERDRNRGRDRERETERD